MTCAACGTENEVGRKFCGECGRPLARACAACGAPSVEFCGECGTPLVAPAAAPEQSRAPVAAPQAERRLVSVLFVDLVGFTAASEARDAEETRELLTRYFDLARTLEGKAHPYCLGAVLVDYGRRLVGTGRSEEAAPLPSEARRLFDTMGATAWLRRIERSEAETPRPLELAG